MCQHTPGPWEVVGSRICTVANDIERITLAKTEPGGAFAMSEQQEANATLLAAAPAMYEALQMVSTILYDIADSAEDVAEWNEGGQMYELSRVVKTALAQAEGKG